MWLDCDREGENICFEVLDIVLAQMQNPRTVYRAKFSALSEVDVENALVSLTKPNKNESQSVDCRQLIDLKIGCAFTRFQSTFFDSKYGDLDSKLVSFGPCQTPTLKFVVDRADEIARFVPQPFWFLDASVDCNGVPIKLDWKKQRSFEKRTVMDTVKALSKEKVASVVSVDLKKKKKIRPLGLNTVTEKTNRNLELLPVCSWNFFNGILVY